MTTPQTDQPGAVADAMIDDQFYAKWLAYQEAERTFNAAERALRDARHRRNNETRSLVADAVRLGTDNADHRKSIPALREACRRRYNSETDGATA